MVRVAIIDAAFNAYGVSFPGAPTVIIGFNDSCSFGFTNSGRDVRDFYEIKFKDSTMQEYWFDSTWKQTTFRDEVIKIKDKADDTEHIAMTVFGPGCMTAVTPLTSFCRAKLMPAVGWRTTAAMK